MGVLEVGRRWVGGRWITDVRDESDGGGGGQTIEQVVFPFSFDTPGLVYAAPPSGYGIAALTLNAGDVLLNGSGAFNGGIYISTLWDGSAPVLDSVLKATRPVGPGVSGFSSPTALDQGQTQEVSQDDHSAFAPAYQFPECNFGQILATETTYLWIVVFDANNAPDDPGSSQGEAELRLFVARATA